MQVDLMQSLSLLSWLARMWRWTQTWPSSSPWTLAMPGGQTYQTTSSNSLGGKPIICMYTHVCCMHVPCAYNIIGIMIHVVCMMMMEIWHSVMSLISSHNSLTGSNNCSMLWLLISNAFQLCIVNFNPLFSPLVLPWRSQTVSLLLRWCCTPRDSELQRFWLQRLYHSSSKFQHSSICMVWYACISSLYVPTCILIFACFHAACS